MNNDFQMHIFRKIERMNIIIDTVIVYIQSAIWSRSWRYV